MSREWASLGFMGRDLLVPREKGTEFLSLSWDKGTMGQKSLHFPGTKGQQDMLNILPLNRPGRDFDILPWDRQGQDLDYCMRAIIGCFWFEAALVYKPRILSLKNEEFPFLVHKLFVI